MPGHVNALIELEKKRCETELPSVPTLMVYTTPSRFPSMWAWLGMRIQWVLEKEWDGGKLTFISRGQHSVRGGHSR